MSRTIFYSWQSDLPNSTNRGFLSDVLSKVIKGIHKSDEYNLDLNLDRDTSGMTGSPEIANAIFDKIQNSEIFVCDISIINNGSSESRKVPNPNVMMELGYAAAVVGWDNIICLFNESFGHIKDMPFDIQQRRVIPYRLENEDSKKNETKENLVRRLISEVTEIGVEKVFRNRKIISAYRNESSLAMKIALNKPSMWEFKLSEALMRDKLAEINSLVEMIDDGSYFIPSIKKDGKTLMHWAQEQIRDAGSLIKATESCFKIGWMKAVGEPGVVGDEIRILQSINRINQLMLDMINWEIGVRAIYPPEELKTAFFEMRHVFRPTLNEFNEFPEQLASICATKEKNFIFTISTDFAPSFTTSFNTLISYFKQNGINAN